MLSRTLIAARPASRRAAALFSTSARTMAAGDVGSPSPTGGQGDAFKKREKANEDYTIRQRELERLQVLKKKLHEQHEHLTKLRESIEEMEKEQGGEQK